MGRIDTDEMGRYALKKIIGASFQPVSGGVTLFG